jgi:hypothetical protein
VSKVAKDAQQRLTFSATQVDLGVELTSHRFGDCVGEVPLGSHAAVIGLQQGDIITKAGFQGQLQYPVKYYQGVHKVLYFLENDTAVSAASPLVFTVLRGVPPEANEDFKPVARPRTMSMSTAASTDVRSATPDILDLSKDMDAVSAGSI